MRTRKCPVEGSFLPLHVFETLGGCSDRTVDVLSGIGRRLSQRLSPPIVDTVRHLFQLVVVTLWKGNAALWIQRSHCCAPSVGGVL